MAYGLRDTAQGAALRTRKPFEKGLSESFIRGAVLFRFRVFFHQSLRHLHGRLAGFESKRQVRLTARIE